MYYRKISHTHTGKKHDLDFLVFTKPIWLIFELTIEYHLFQLQSSAIHLVLVFMSCTISVISYCTAIFKSTVPYMT